MVLVLITFWYGGEHNFLLTTGKTFAGTTAGVWASYTPPKEGPGVLTMLYATKESRHYTPHVLGALGLHSLRTYGELPEGSHNLSCHSIGIQRRLASVLGQVPATAVVNKENWFNSLSYNQQWSEVVKGLNYEDITYDIENGKQFLLDVIKGRTVL